MAFVHILGFAHRDLKSQIVLYDHYIDTIIDNISINNLVQRIPYLFSAYML